MHASFRLGLIALAVALLSPALAATQALDPTFAEHQKAWTTRPEFSSPLVDHLPAGGAVPSPRDVLGHDIGAPRVLDYYADILKYYRALAAASPCVKIIETGKTEEGRPTVMVVISSPANMANLEQNRRNLVRLGDPRGLSPDEAKSLIAKTRPMYVLLGGLHSGETGPPEMLMELAYRLVMEDSPLIQRIRDNVIIAINPATDPDGRDRYTDWYYENKIDDTDDLDPVPGSPYWGKYIFHDDNRDINYSGYSATNLLKWYLDWRPQVMHDLHESVPFLYAFSGQPPQNPDLDPILYAELPWFADFEMAQLTKMGMPGVWNFGYVDAWSPGYVAFMSSNHNGLVRFYETFGNGGATTELRHVKPVDGPGQDQHTMDQTKREWFRPNPPYKTVEWSMRDNTNYMETAMLTALQLTSQFPDQILENFYKKNLDPLEAGRTKPPYAFIIPGDQPDMTRAALLVNILRLQGIEVGRTDAPLKLADGTFAAGSFVVKLDQPYGRLAKVLLQKQDFPDPKLKTYDDSAWTMGMMAHVKVAATKDAKVLQAAAPPIERDEPTGAIDPPGASAYAVLDHGSIELARLRYRLKDTPIRIAEQGFTSGGKAVPAGSFIVDGSAYEKLRAEAVPLGLSAVALEAQPPVSTHEAAAPRVAVYSTWGSTQNVGWVRYAFDQYGTPYSLIFKDDVRKGRLRARYDVIVVPSQGRNSRALVWDVAVRGKPLAYEKTARYRYLGDYGASPDIRGGMGLDGLEAFRQFVEQGGLLITLGDSSAMPADFGIAPDVQAAPASKDFYAPGPIVQAKITKTGNPVFYGYDETSFPVRWATNTLFAVPDTRRDEVLMEFPGGKSGVLSGLMTAPDEVKHRPAIIDQPLGEGRILMFATNPIYRDQTFGEYRMLYNALFSYRQLGLGTELPAPAGDDATGAGSDPAEAKPAD